MTEGQRIALNILTAAHSSCVYVEYEGWVWADDIRQSPDIADKVLLLFHNPTKKPFRGQASYTPTGA